MVVVLQYHRGFASKLMDAIEFVQHPVKRDQVAHCPTLHYFYEDRSFLGLTVSSFAGAFFEFRSTGIPFQPVTSRKWTYADNSWHGCGGLHQLDCFFLPGSSCDLSKRDPPSSGFSQTAYTRAAWARAAGAPTPPRMRRPAS